MSPLSPSLLLFTALALAGCWPDFLHVGYTDADSRGPGPGMVGPPADSDDCYAITPPELQEINVDPDPEGVWSYQLRLAGWVGGADLSIWGPIQHTTREEQHEFEQGPFDSCGEWDEWVLDLDVVEDSAEQQAGSSTLFPATDEQAALMTWMVTLYDVDLFELECWTWGAEPETFSAYDCETWR